MAFVYALVLNMAICAVWYLVEYMQFGKLQLHRKCDNVVWILYLLILWALFAQIL